MFNPVSQIFRFILKLVLGLFAISLLFAALIALAVSLLKALITGRKPASAVVFSRFQQFSRQGIWPNRATQNAPKAASGQIVDVEAREIPEDRRKS